MSALHTFVRRLNLTAMTTPAILRIGQQGARDIGSPEVVAAARWGVAAGLVIYWMIEPNFEEAPTE